MARCGCGYTRKTSAGRKAKRIKTCIYHRAIAGGRASARARKATTGRA